MLAAALTDGPVLTRLSGREPQTVLPTWRLERSDAVVERGHPHRAGVAERGSPALALDLTLGPPLLKGSRFGGSRDNYTVTAS